MGSTAWSDDAYKSIKSNYQQKTQQQVFTSSSMPKDMSPIGVKFRESRDSAMHPNSLAVGVFVDVTGSMGDVPEILIKEKLGALMNTMTKHGVQDPQIMFGAIGDSIYDEAALQVGQFESGTKELDHWLTQVWLEGGGGGNMGESYPLAWLFAARHTSIDCFEKRQEKGFLFTIGDENFHAKLNESDLAKVMGPDYPRTEVTAAQLLKEAQRTYHVFHIMVKHGGPKEARNNNDYIYKNWHDLMGENLLILEDHEAVGELIASTVAVVHGADLKSVVRDFDKSIAAAVGNALVQVSASKGVQKSNGVVKL
jgi:hypothetical protein